MKPQITNQHSNIVAVQPSTTFHKEDRMKSQSSMSLLKKSPLAVIIMVCAILPATMSVGQGPSPAKDAGQATGGQLRGAISVELAKSLDSKKLKEGDEVDAKLAADIQTGDATIPRGTKLIGHVTEAKARSKGDSESTLGIVFDRMSRRTKRRHAHQERHSGGGPESEGGRSCRWRHVRRAERSDREIYFFADGGSDR